MSGIPPRPENDPTLEPAPSVAAMQQLRTRLGPAIRPHQALALFDVGDSACYLLVSEGSHGHPTPVAHYMHLGLQLLVQRTFKKSMPSAAQLEAGITVVEDAVMPLARLLPPGAVLATRDPLLLDIARHATGQNPLALTAPGPGSAPPAASLEAIEALFARLVAQASPGGARSAAEGPQDPAWAAALLILREAMQHWQFRQLQLLPPR